jgi:hypothetical protein
VEIQIGRLLFAPEQRGKFFILDWRSPELACYFVCEMIFFPACNSRESVWIFPRSVFSQTGLFSVNYMALCAKIFVDCFGSLIFGDVPRRLESLLGYPLLR